MGYLEELKKRGFEAIDAFSELGRSQRKASLVSQLFPYGVKQAKDQSILEGLKSRNDMVKARQAAAESNAPAPPEEPMSMAPPPTPVTGAAGFGVGGTAGTGADLLEEVRTGGGAGVQPAAKGAGAVAPSPGRPAVQTGGPATAEVPRFGRVGVPLIDVPLRLFGGKRQVYLPVPEDTLEAEANGVAATIQEGRALEQAGKATPASRKKVLGALRSVHERYPQQGAAAAIISRGTAKARTMEEARKAEEFSRDLASGRIEERAKRLRRDLEGRPKSWVQQHEEELLRVIAEKGKGALEQRDRDFLDERARASWMSRLMQGLLAPTETPNLGTPGPDDIDSMAALFEQQNGTPPTDWELRTFMEEQGYQFPSK